MKIIVQKFGGSSLSDKGKLEQVSEKIIDTYNKGYKVVVVVSAQGKTTDSLLENISEYSKNNHKREIDIVLSTGEMQSAALLTMLLKDKGIEAVALTGEQAGIITSSDYGEAKIVNILKENIQRYIDNNIITVVTGFQGADKFGNITTLGRGGSDLTAVALASTLKAIRCEIFTDVDRNLFS